MVGVRRNQSAFVAPGGVVGRLAVGGTQSDAVFGVMDGMSVV